MLKLTKNILLIALMGTIAAAQSTAAKPAAGQKPAATTPASQTVKPAAKPAAPATAAKTPAKPAAGQTAAKTPAKPAAAASSTATATGKGAKALTKQATAKPTHRDPFISPVRMAAEKTGGSPQCTTGARCLQIDQVELKGVVKTRSGMIAMVENTMKKEYNLREKDPVFNGFVLKITGDSIVFRETTTDNMGHPATREVVKRVTVPVV